MKQFEFTEDYGEYGKGNVIEPDNEDYHKFIHPLLARGVLKVVGETKTPSLADMMAKKKMHELRVFGKQYGAKDTKKIELIEEIIEKAPIKDIKEFCEVD